MSKKHQKREKLLCNPQEWRRSSREVGETPGNGEESPSFGEEPYIDEISAPSYLASIIIFSMAFVIRKQIALGSVTRC